jgi:hypothetical protein
VSNDDSDKPSQRRLNVTEEALGENEMSRVKRRTVTQPLKGASEARLREFRERLDHNEQAETLSRLLDDSYFAAIDKWLVEFAYPPIRGWVRVREDGSWEPLPDGFNARLAAEHDRLAEGRDPNSGLRIEAGVNYTKRHAEPHSQPWWLAHLGDLIMTIRSERDPKKLLVLVFTLGRDYQRYLDQHVHLAKIQHGASFPTGNTDKATQKRILKRKTHKEGIISLCKRALRKGKGRKKNGDINASELFRIYMDFGYRDIGDRHVRGIIAEAIKDGDLA